MLLFSYLYVCAFSSSWHLRGNCWKTMTWKCSKTNKTKFLSWPSVLKDVKQADFCRHSHQETRPCHNGKGCLCLIQMTQILQNAAGLITLRKEDREKNYGYRSLQSKVWCFLSSVHNSITSNRVRYLQPYYRCMFDPGHDLRHKVHGLRRLLLVDRYRLEVNSFSNQ